MNKESTSNNIQNDGFDLNTEDSDYKILINSLKEISKNITLLKKKYFENF